MTNQQYCTCENPFKNQDELGAYCSGCGLRFEPATQLTVDRAFLLQLAQIGADARMADLMLDGYTIDAARTLQAKCERILEEYGE